MARILMVASEATPFVKTGGLADVLGSLPPALARRGEDVAVVIPRYRAVSLDGARLVMAHVPLWIGPYQYSASIYRAEHQSVPYYLVDSPVFFDREGVYGTPAGEHWDNDTRFAALCHAALAVARHLFRPNIIHCHDWQAALLPVYLRQFFSSDPTFLGTRTVFTIHNMGYQGNFGKERLYWLGLPEWLFRPDMLECYGRINLLKGGIISSDQITTVSPTYAQEIQSPAHGFGLDGLMRARAGHLSGILNGIDYAEWNPATDRHLAAHYAADDLAGKRECKLDLRRELHLPAHRPEVPVVGIVSRFAAQKGFDLIAHVAHDLVHWDIQLAVLGAGDAQYADLFRALAAARPEKFAVRVGYNESLAHKIEAGADIFLMPSHYEPCGLNQMYSLRYGTVPVVHATGGLEDSIDEATGFKFRHYSGEAMLGALRAALDRYWGDPVAWTAMMKEGMGRDLSWDASAASYSALYRHLLA